MPIILEKQFNNRKIIFLVEYINQFWPKTLTIILHFYNKNCLKDVDKTWVKNKTLGPARIGIQTIPQKFALAMLYIKHEQI